MSAEQTLESLVELLEKFNYKKDEDSDSYSFFEAKLNEDWFFHLVEEAKRGVVEIAKLREELAEVKSEAKLVVRSLAEKLEAAEAKLKAASEQEPVAYLGKVAHHNWSGGEPYYTEKLSKYPHGMKDVKQLYAAPATPEDVQELQAKLDAVVENAVYLQSNQAQRIDELERKLAEHQALNDDVFGIARSSGAEELNTLLAQAREEGRKDAVPDGWQVVPKEPTEEVLQAVRDGISLAKRISADEAAIAYGVMLTSAPKLEVKP